MPARLTHAILRLPGNNFATGLTTSRLGTPDLRKTINQHARYCEALKDCGLSIRVEKEEPRFPDSTFVEDTAVLTPHCAILTHPGAASRLEEVEAIRPVIQDYFDTLERIQPPGTLDGGDVCDADGHYFIGVSKRTNEAGARQLVEILARYGFSSDLIDLSHQPGILHLKSGVAYLGERHLAAIQPFLHEALFSDYHKVPVSAGEEYAANCIRINDHFLVANGFPNFTAAVSAMGYPVITLDMSEFRKMDGGLSCLSLRF